LNWDIDLKNGEAQVSTKSKGTARKFVNVDFGTSGSWKVVGGFLRQTKPGNPGNVKKLFNLVAEKIPFGVLGRVRKVVAPLHYGTQGVYVAHDSMGWPRYIGRGEVFSRLKARKKTNSEELQYFSIYIIAEKKHTREIETLLIRTVGSLLSFNNRKKRLDNLTGRISDYEVGTDFVERQSRKGRLKPIDPI
jgi:hypothetical protein